MKAAAVTLALAGAFLSATDGRYKQAAFLAAVAAGTAVAAKRRRRAYWLREAR